MFRVEEEAEQETSLKAAGKKSSACHPEDGGGMFLRNVFIVIHGVISKKIVLLVYVCPQNTNRIDQ
jgi:hypothetical protein